MTLFWAAVDPQQAAAEPKDHISACSRALPGGIWQKKVRLNFLSSNRLRGKAKLVGETVLKHGFPRLVAPVSFELASIADLKQEIFGPVLHVVRWGGDPMEVIRQINARGYGLTLGIETRIDSRAQRMVDAARIGNVYINRNMIGAVVGVQPFGGEGLSGTGPKAGGPQYLYRFCVEQTVTVNTSAAGGNAELLAGLG